MILLLRYLSDLNSTEPEVYTEICSKKPTDPENSRLKYSASGCKLSFLLLGETLEFRCQ